MRSRFWFWALTQKGDVFSLFRALPPHLFFVFLVVLGSLYSYQYWTLNPGQEATEPQMSPRDPVRSVIRAAEVQGGTLNDGSNVV
jgi:hypothetical protein